jgi:hypothetical protein
MSEERISTPDFVEWAENDMIEEAERYGEHWCPRCHSRISVESTVCMGCGLILHKEDRGE